MSPQGGDLGQAPQYSPQCDLSTSISGPRDHRGVARARFGDKGGGETTCPIQSTDDGPSVLWASKVRSKLWSCREGQWCQEPRSTYKAQLETQDRSR